MLSPFFATNASRRQRRSVSGDRCRRWLSSGYVVTLLTNRLIASLSSTSPAPVLAPRNPINSMKYGKNKFPGMFLNFRAKISTVEAMEKKVTPENQMMVRTFVSGCHLNFPIILVPESSCINCAYRIGLKELKPRDLTWIRKESS